MRSCKMIQPKSETKAKTKQIEDTALHTLNNHADVYRIGKTVIFTPDGMDGFTLCECEEEVNAEIIALCLSYSRTQPNFGDKVRGWITKR